LASQGITIIVKLGEPFWRKVGQRKLQLALPKDASVQDALARLQSDYPELEPALRGQELGRLSGLPVAVFVEDQLVRLEKAGDVTLHSGQRLHILLPVGGG
jgi:sulfur carrier protein ThiS